MLLGVRPWGYSREQDRQVILFQKPLSRDGGSHVANQVLRAPREAGVAAGAEDRASGGPEGLHRGGSPGGCLQGPTVLTPRGGKDAASWRPQPSLERPARWGLQRAEPRSGGASHHSPNQTDPFPLSVPLGPQPRRLSKGGSKHP